MTSRVPHPADIQPRAATSPGQPPTVPVPDTAPRVAPLQAGHADAASVMLADAFFDDPLLQIVAPDKATRRRWGPWFMGATVGYGLRWGEVWCADEHAAVAVWAPPDSGDMSLG